MNRPLPCVSYGSFEMSASDFGTVGMCRQKASKQALINFLLLTEGVVQSVYKFVTRSSFSVTW